MTNKELKTKNDIEIIIDVLEERRRHLIPYSPFGIRLSNIISKLYKGEIKEVNNA